jgi:hypothetical protein
MFCDLGDLAVVYPKLYCACSPVLSNSLSYHNSVSGVAGRNFFCFLCN